MGGRASGSWGARGVRGPTAAEAGAESGSRVAAGCWGGAGGVVGTGRAGATGADVPAARLAGASQSGRFAGVRGGGADAPTAASSVARRRSATDPREARQSRQTRRPRKSVSDSSSRPQNTQESWGLARTTRSPSTVTSTGSPSRMPSVRRIPAGITTRPRSSTLRRIPLEAKRFLRARARCRRPRELLRTIAALERAAYRRRVTRPRWSPPGRHRAHPGRLSRPRGAHRSRSIQTAGPVTW